MAQYTQILVGRVTSAGGPPVPSPGGIVCSTAWIEILDPVPLSGWPPATEQLQPTARRVYAYRLIRGPLALDDLVTIAQRADGYWIILASYPEPDE